MILLRNTFGARLSLVDTFSSLKTNANLNTRSHLSMILNTRGFIAMKITTQVDRFFPNVHLFSSFTRCQSKSKSAAIFDRVELEQRSNKISTRSKIAGEK